MANRTLAGAGGRACAAFAPRSSPGPPAGPAGAAERGQPDAQERCERVGALEAQAAPAVDGSRQIAFVEVEELS